MILNRAIRRAVRYFPDNTATICHGRKQSYRELSSCSTALSKALHELGVRRGEKVAVYLLNCPQFLEIVYACFEIGAVIVPLNTRLASDELVFIINDAECKAFITDEILAPHAATFKSNLRGVEHFIALNGAEPFVDYEGLVNRFLNEQAQPVSNEDQFSENMEELVGLFYTSGTTGLPKGVMLNHRNLWMNAMHTLATRAPES